MGRNMVTYNHNKTESKHAMLTNNEMLEVTKYSEMKMELYLVIQGNNSYTPVNHKKLNKYIGKQFKCQKNPLKKEYNNNKKSPS